MQLPRFYPILDTAAAHRAGVDALDAAREILDGGARILQFRHKQFLSRGAFDLLARIAEVTQQSGALLVVNDRADLARLFSGALHLGQDDLPPRAARTVTGPDLLIGFSTHNEAQLRASADEPVDYVALGPMFGTSSKENPDPVVGVEQLRRLRPLTSRPVVAIGGIDLANAPAVIDAGADSVSVIGGLFPEDGGIRQRVQQWTRLLA